MHLSRAVDVDRVIPHSSKVVVDKVLCYIVREGRLLVFRHTDYSYEEVGIQVPGAAYAWVRLRKMRRCARPAKRPG